MRLGVCSPLLLLALLRSGAEGQDSADSKPIQSQLIQLQRQLLKATAPERLHLQDALGITWKEGFLIGPGFQSPVKWGFYCRF